MTKKIISGILAFSLLICGAYSENNFASDITNSISASADLVLGNTGYIGEIIKSTDDAKTVKYNFDPQTGILTISGKGKIRDFTHNYDESPFWGYIAQGDGHNGIKKAVIEEGVTALGRMTFMECYDLEEVTLPDTVTVIGISAFEACKALTSVNNFKNIEAIENYAFDNCSELTQITIPETTKQIGKYAFFRCPKMSAVKILNPDVQIDDFAFGYYYTKQSSDMLKSDILKIYGYTGSTAQNYAEKNGFEFIPLDAEQPAPENYDINGDGEVDARDALNILQMVTSASGFTDEQIKAADIDGDGETGAHDALVILQWVVGL